MRKIVREDDFPLQERNIIRELATVVGITETTAGILYARGQDTEEKMRRFLHPSRLNFLSPYLLSGMREAVELIKRARDEEWRMVVFGDYDADGIGALTILYRALKQFGIEAELFVPEREDGYGLNVDAIDEIFDNCLPDLFITVDCGISCAREVEYIKEQGAYVIVTDHHELPEILPDCICINPKIKDDYPYDNLCGAGVAFKLASALIGEKANDLLDFCALSTVADSVTLLGENRDIVSEGLKLISENPRAAFSALLGDKSDITAQTLSFTVAPRINAAGRMGDARSALELFISEDEEEISALAEKLNAYNLERQRLCDELYEKAHQRIAEEGAYDEVIMLVGEDWHAGLIGIVAARLAEEFSRPALLFVKKGNNLRGSARSIESINIYEALKASSHLMEEFGGHAQAAGVGMSEENFATLKSELNAYLKAHYTREDFEPALIVSGVIEGEFPWTLARELNRLEPYGVGNRKPYFLVATGKMNASLLKPLSPHVALSGSGMEYVYFSGAKDLQLLRSDIQKQLIFECSISKFRGRESLKGIIRALCYDGAEGEDSALYAFENVVRSLGLENIEAENRTISELNELIREREKACAYGLCVVAQTRESLRNFPSLSAFPREAFRISSGSVRNAVLIAPSQDCDLSAYREIVFLESPVILPIKTGRAQVYANSEASILESVKRLKLDRDSMVQVYTYLRKMEGQAAFKSYAETARAFACERFSNEQIIFALAVFEELGIFDFTEGRMRLVRGKKTELSSSKIYSAALRLKETE